MSRGKASSGKQSKAPFPNGATPLPPDPVLFAPGQKNMHRAGKLKFVVPNYKLGKSYRPSKKEVELNSQRPDPAIERARLRKISDGIELDYIKSRKDDARGSKPDTKSYQAAARYSKTKKVKRKGQNVAPILFDLKQLPERALPLVNREIRRLTEKDIYRATKWDLKKKIRHKAMAFTIADNLLKANPNSRLADSYRNTMYYCQHEYVQDGRRISSKYCNARHCYACNRIRSGKLINNYTPFLNWLGSDIHMVTLTVPNVPAAQLKGEVAAMVKDFQKIKDVMRKTHGMRIVGLRKMECTHNQDADTFHPHFHLLVQNYEHASMLRWLWIEHRGDVDPALQHMVQADMNSAKELFKYFTKFWSKKKNNTDKIIDYVAQDTIYNSISGRRIFQPFGMNQFKKETQAIVDESEDVEPCREMHYNIEPRQETFQYQSEVMNYINTDTGECILPMRLTKKDTKLLQAFNDSLVIAQPRERPAWVMRGNDGESYALSDNDEGLFEQLNKQLNL